MDMFSDEPPAKKVKFSDSESKTEDNKSTELQWEYKWEDNDTCEVHGPFSNKQMLEWQETDFFSKGAFVRKIETNPGGWYNSKRIDFDLYT